MPKKISREKHLSSEYRYYSYALKTKFYGKDKPDTSKDVPVEELELSEKTYKALKKGGIDTLGKLISLSKDKLQETKAFGNKCVEVTIDALHKFYDKYMNEDVDFFWISRELVLSYAGKIIETKESLYAAAAVSAFDLTEGGSEKLKRFHEKLVEKGILKKAEADGSISYELVPLSVSEAAKSLKGRQRDCLERYIFGETYESIGESYGVTRERIRQIIKTAIREARRTCLREGRGPYFEEERYRDFFRTYFLLKKEWIDGCGLPPEAYAFLVINEEKGERPFTELDEKFSSCKWAEDAWRKYGNKVAVNGEEIGNDINGILCYTLKTRCRDAMRIEDIIESYNDVIEENGLDRSFKLTTGNTDIRKFEGRISRSEMAISGGRKMYRYYDFNGKDYTELLDEIDLGKYKNIELHTDRIFEDHPEIMKKYDIRTGNELHNLLRRIEDQLDVDIEFGKMPLIRFGEFDREKAVKEIYEKSGCTCSSSELARRLHAVYGGDNASLIADWVPLAYR